jgi:hypothetical protein
MNLQRCARLLVALAATALFAACQREVSPPDLAGVVEPLEAGTERFVLDGGARDRASMQDDRGADAVACGDPAKGDLVIPYPGTGSGIASTSFTLTVNCKPVFVEEFSGISYAHFAFAGTAHLSLLTTANAASYTLSPTSSGIHPVVNGAVTTFDLTVPRKLLFWARTTGANLIILADPPEDESYSSRPSTWLRARPSAARESSRTTLPTCSSPTASPERSPRVPSSLSSSSAAPRAPG